MCVCVCEVAPSLPSALSLDDERRQIGSVVVGFLMKVTIAQPPYVQCNDIHVHVHVCTRIPVYMMYYSNLLSTVQ